MSAVAEVYEYLIANGVQETNTWDVIRRRLTDAPVRDRVVVVAEDGGLPPETKAASGIGDAALADVGVHVTVRAEEWNSDASAAKAQAVLDLLHGLHAVQLVSGGTRYLRIAAQTAEPVWVGYDEKNRPLHTVAFRLLAEL